MHQLAVKGIFAVAVGENTLLHVDVQLGILTWITVILLCAILYPVAWKPILNRLDEREQTIRKSLADAAQARKDLSLVESKCRAILNEAEQQAQGIVDAAREAAATSARQIKEGAKSEAAAQLSSARRTIRAEQDKALFVLKKESAALAIDLAEKLLRSGQLTQNRQELIARIIEETEGS